MPWTRHLLGPLCPASLAKAGKMSPEVGQDIICILDIMRMS